MLRAVPNLFRPPGRSARAPLNTELLDSERVAQVVRAALDRLGLHLIVTDDGEVARIFGTPGTALPFEFTASLTTIQDGLVVTELLLPVVIPEEQIEDALELCLWLTAGSRFVYTLRERRPCLRFPFELLTVSADNAADWLCGLFGLFLQRASGCFLAFQAVAAGSTAAESLVGLGRVSAGAMWRRSWTDEPRAGTRWDVAGTSTPNAEEWSVPPGYTVAEYRATHAALKHLTAVGLQGGVRDACAGPILIHADGAVECYGCDSPATNPHVVGTTVACHKGSRLGTGHLCERCGPST